MCLMWSLSLNLYLLLRVVQWAARADEDKSKAFFITLIPNSPQPNRVALEVTTHPLPTFLRVCQFKKRFGQS